MTYVEQLARQSLRMLSPLPRAGELPASVLGDVDEEEFLRAFEDYQDVLRRIYTLVLQAPASFGMCALPALTGYKGPVTPDEGKSRKEFYRLPLTLLAIAQKGRWTADGLLSVSPEDFRGYKIPRPAAIFQNLADCGFVFEGLKDGFSPAPDAPITVAFPDNPAVLSVLKAFACVKTPENMLMADYRFMLYENWKDIPFSIEDILRVAGEEGDKAVLRAVYDFFIAKGYHCRVEYAGFFGKVRFSRSKAGKESMIVPIDRDLTVEFHPRFAHINSYTELIKTAPQNLQGQLVSGRECVHCGGCKAGPVNFTYEGCDYHKCGVICCTFPLSHLTAADIPSLLSLLEAETALGG